MSTCIGSCQLIVLSYASPSDNLILLNYSMPVFSANLFGLFKMIAMTCRSNIKSFLLFFLGKKEFKKVENDKKDLPTCLLRLIDLDIEHDTILSTNHGVMHCMKRKL